MKFAFIVLITIICLSACQTKPDNETVNPEDSIMAEQVAEQDAPVSEDDNTAPSSSEKTPEETPQKPEISFDFPREYPRVDGSTANMPLMAAIYSYFNNVPLEEAETMIETSGGTGAVWRNMIYGGADLLLVYEAPENVKQEMVGIPYNIGTPLNATDENAVWWRQFEITPIGRDGLVFLVNKNNPVDNLSIEQLQGIYSGAITDWSEVGGEPGSTIGFQRNEESGSQTLFLKLLMGDLVPTDAPRELRPAMMGELIDAVAAFDGSGGAIGFSVFYYANLMYENPNLKILSVDGIAPSAESIGSGAYPLINDFYAVIWEREAAESPARFIRDWLLTEEGKALMAGMDYVPVR